MIPEVPDPLEGVIKGMKLPGVRGAWRDQLIFAAGQASVQRRSKRWIAPGSLVMGLLAGLFMGSSMLQHQKRESASPINANVAPKQHEAPILLLSESDQTYHAPAALVEGVTDEARRAWHDRELVLRLGVDSLPIPSILISTDKPISVRDMLIQEALR